MLVFNVESVLQTQALGEALGALVRAGDLLMLTGDLGTGKTTFTQGLGRGMGVEGRVASPTFIISRTHRGGVFSEGVKGPDLVHVDAYRVTDLDDLETLDLDSALRDAVVVVEWGEGKTEALSADRLEITLLGDELDVSAVSTDLEGMDSGRRVISFNPVGSRWDESVLEAAFQAALVSVEGDL